MNKLNMSEESSEIGWMSSDSRNQSKHFAEKYFDQNMNLLSSDRVLNLNQRNDAAIDSDGLIQARSQFLKELRELESQNEIRLRERTKEILVKVKEEYKPLIDEL